MDCKEARELLHAYVDHELGPRDAGAARAHFERCAACRAEMELHAALRPGVAAQATYYRAPAAFAARLRDELASTHPDRPPPRAAFAWLGQHAGAAVASFVAVVASLALFLALPEPDMRLGDEVVASHVRALLSDRVTDVASSDQHTVKPWFNGRLDYAPPVQDLTADGFPLVGGRRDYIDHRPVAVLVYRRRQHTIDLYVWPAANGAADAGPQAVAANGYQMLHWRRAGMNYWAVSDVDAAQLVLLRDKLAAER